MTASLAKRAGSSHHWQAAVSSSESCWKSWSCAAPLSPAFLPYPHNSIHLDKSGSYQLRLKIALSSLFKTLNHYHPSPDLVKGNGTFQRYFSWHLCHLAAVIKLHHYRKQRVTLWLLFPRHNSQHWQMLCTYDKLIEEEERVLDQIPTRNIIHMWRKRGKNTAQRTNLLV